MTHGWKHSGQESWCFSSLKYELRGEQRGLGAAACVLVCVPAVILQQSTSTTVKRLSLHFITNAGFFLLTLIIWGFYLRIPSALRFNNVFAEAQRLMCLIIRLKRRCSVDTWRSHFRYSIALAYMTPPHVRKAPMHQSSPQQIYCLGWGSGGGGVGLIGGPDG